MPTGSPRLYLPDKGSLNKVNAGSKILSFTAQKNNAPLAQLVEHLTLNQWAAGSSPSRCTRKINGSGAIVYFFGVF